jgi:hypothetical protein
MAQQYPSDTVTPTISQPPAPTSVWAIVSLIAGILGWLGIFGLGGIAAIICGYLAKNEINKSEGKIGGNGIATAGLVLGWLNVALTCIGVCLTALVITGAVTLPFFLQGVHIFPNQ